MTDPEMAAKMISTVSIKEEKNSLTYPEGGYRAYIVLFAAFLGMAGPMGFINATGILQLYISEDYLRDICQLDIGWIFSVFNFLTFSVSLFGGPLFDLYGLRVTMVLGLVTFSVGVMLISVSRAYYQFFLSFVATGIGSSFVFTTNVGVVGHFFFKRRALMSGFVFCGGGIGGIAYSLLMRSLLPKIGFPWTVRVVGFINIGLLTTELILLRDRRKEIQAHNKDLTLFQKTLGKIDLRAFKDFTFLFLVVAMLTSGFALLITMTYITSYSLAQGFTSQTSYILLIVLNAASVVGRLSGGFFADKYGRFNAMCVINGTSTLCFLVLWMPPPIGHSVGGLFTFASVYGITSGSNLSLGPSVMGQISLTEDYASRYSTASVLLGILNLVGILVGGAIAGNYGSSKGFDNLAVFIGAISILGTITSFLARYFHAGLARVCV